MLCKRFHFLNSFFNCAQVRVPTHIVSTICDDRGEEPTYAGQFKHQLCTCHKDLACIAMSKAAGLIAAQVVHMLLGAEG